MNKRHVLRRAALTSFLAIGGGATAAVAGPVTWSTAVGGNGNVYEVIVDDSVSWDAARSAAQAAGGDLATIESQAEQGFIESILSSAAAPQGSYWFGLGETATEGVYQAINGGSQPFTHWLPGEPNNSGGVENVAAVLWSPDAADAGYAARRGFWTDEPVSGYPAAGAPTPGELDVFRGGYLVEHAADDSGGGDGGGEPNAIPLPAAALTFPLGAAFAGIFYRRMRTRA